MGRPYLMLGGELEKTSALEPKEGKFDFSVIDALLEGAREVLQRMAPDKAVSLVD